jgi:hypothetical protein
MAEIQEYSSQVAAPEPVGGVSPNIELAGAVGRSIENVGNTLDQVGTGLHRRAVQQQSADVYQQTATKRAEIFDAIHQGMADGSLNEDKINEMLDHAYDGVLENTSTPEASNYLKRQQARLRGSVLQKLSISKASMAFNEAQTSFGNSLNIESGTVYKNPTPAVFQSSYEGMVEQANQLLPDNEKARDRLIHQSGQELTKQVILGMAEQDPNSAAKMLDGGAYDQFLNGDQRRVLRSEILSASNRKDIETERRIRVQKEVQQAKFHDWFNGASDLFETNQLTPDMVQDAFHQGKMDGFQRHEIINMISQRNKKELTSDPQKEIQVYNDIVHGQINNPFDVYSKVGNGGLSWQSATKLASLAEDKDGYLAMYKAQMKTTMDHGMDNIIHQNPMTLTNDGYDQASQYMQDLINHTMNSSKTGVPPAALLDPNSKDWFGNRVGMYRKNWQDHLQDVAQDRGDKALGYRPSKENPDAKRPKEAYMPDEANDPQKFLDRINNKKETKDMPPPPARNVQQTAPRGAQDDESRPISANDDIGYMLDKIGLYGPNTKIDRDKQAALREEEEKARAKAGAKADRINREKDAWKAIQ